MAKGKRVSEAVIKRLPRYYRYLGDLQAKGVTRVSSGELSSMMGLTASQIRQDLNCFGGFGQQGYGYTVEFLYHEIGNILGLNRELNCILIGAGNLGHAIANYANFEKRGFHMTAVFDNNPEIIGKKIKNIPVSDVKQLSVYLSEHKVDIVMLAIPGVAVEKVIDIIYQSDIKGIWNFSYLDLKVPDHIAMVNVHLSDSLMTLAYKISEKERAAEEQE
ncbi:redox-sensing transcriptional repressor Rex [Acetivibrio sp. MSJd-27]|jgi:redox-sensing transcriptional repressor rex|uniref:redox-sensing transcriptional repressor Rex n=1 Tax=Acetivibrio sp. MSJd-27 TaxID=2841523 RepID=UPI001C1256C9|nr:redox-sensing transcriptional repressor Rex [Acetivibrio sp. MSJd-27]MBU5451515.1 redox-sensing transcriptional repressor Rex [Acetivibrio sp. MSJd-27]